MIERDDHDQTLGTYPRYPHWILVRVGKVFQYQIIRQIRGMLHEDPARYPTGILDHARSRLNQNSL